MATPDQPLAIDHVLARVAAWIADSGLPNTEIASRADVDESSVRQARKPGWSPRIAVLRKLEAIVPADYVAPAGAARDASAGAKAGAGASL